MISYGSCRIGALVLGDSACTSVSQSYIHQSQSSFVDDFSNQGIFVSPDPAGWLLDSVSKYLSSSASVAQVCSTGVTDASQTKRPSHR